MPEEIERMVRRLAEAVARSGRDSAELEQALGLAPGALAELFAGRAELEVRHLLLLGRELGLDPLAFFQEGLAAADARDAGDPILEEVERGVREVEPWRRWQRPPAGAAARDLDLAGAKELVREAIREELVRLARGEPAGARGKGRGGGSGPAGPALAED